MIINSNSLVQFTENILNSYLEKRFIKKNKQKKNNNTFFDWFFSFLWAAGFVLILNQYIFQAYVIPSKSMNETLIVGDRVLVNKFIYGPELLPGVMKFNGFIQPGFGDVVIFENPEYQSKGSAFDILSRLVFMLTLSIVDLDKDNTGNPAHHFLIKRLIGIPGDIITFRNGEVFIKSPDSKEHVAEDKYKKIMGIEYNTIRELESNNYNEAESSIRNSVYINQNSKDSVYYNDLYFSQKTNYKYLSHISPSFIGYYSEYNKKRLGFYMSNKYVLPLGDNRDNSKDGRYYGEVNISDILGSALFKFWPLKRVGEIK